MAHRLSGTLTCVFSLIILVISWEELSAQNSPFPRLIQDTAVAPGSHLLAYGYSATGDSVPVSVVWTATGGTITPDGMYTAGSSAGTYRVIAAAGGLADTALVTVKAPVGFTEPVPITPPGKDRIETKPPPNRRYRMEERERTEVVVTDQGVRVTHSKQKKWVVYWSLLAMTFLFLLGASSREWSRRRVAI
jgi:hypothetical protein